MNRRFTMILPVDLASAAELRANKEKRTLASLIRLAVRAYLDKPSKKTPASKSNDA